MHGAKRNNESRSYHKKGHKNWYSGTNLQAICLFFTLVPRRGGMNGRLQDSKCDTYCMMYAFLKILIQWWWFTMIIFNTILRCSRVERSQSMRVSRGQLFMDFRSYAILFLYFLYLYHQGTYVPDPGVYRSPSERTHARTMRERELNNHPIFCLVFCRRLK